MRAAGGTGVRMSGKVCALRRSLRLKRILSWVRAGVSSGGSRSRNVLTILMDFRP